MNQPPLYPPNSQLGALATLTAASTGGTSALQVNSLWRGVTVFVNVSAITGTTPTFTVTLQGVDPVSGATITLLATTALNATGVHALTVYPGIAVTANVSANTVLPSNWQVIWAIGGTTPAVTATISANYQN